MQRLAFQEWELSPGYAGAQASGNFHHCRGRERWDNAVVESFFSTMELELDLDGKREVLISPQQLQHDSAFWIEVYYKRERSHSNIGYHVSIDYEQQFISTRILTSVTP
ncbi:hypothetical protein IQ216_03895 [Cyanobium sp. LEGE 06143]|uniref:hypothetical protein n=1 Tax=Cyanobium sp. LEGE 06143 TaxID=945727 RepID=UPI00187EA862|nr:hypothetical protein [Cyanobium sp. LEGE 06143]MBE9172252.1 hypothetical protein [Cyanobium sp. LEGE 06143]